MTRWIPAAVLALLVAGCASGDSPPEPKPTKDCSAPDLTVDATEDLPTQVAAKREAIVDAAMKCDYDALGALASGGDQGFTFSFGTGGDPGAYWKEREAEGEPVLDHLVRMLTLPHRTIAADETIYVWPGAAGEGPSDGDRRAVEREFGEEADGWFGAEEGFLGPRVGITADGEWIYYVAGD